MGPKDVLYLASSMFRPNFEFMYFLAKYVLLPYGCNFIHFLIQMKALEFVTTVLCVFFVLPCAYS